MRISEDYVSQLKLEIEMLRRFISSDAEVSKAYAKHNETALCPFCHRADIRSGDGFMWCGNCSAEGPKASTQKEARVLWNERPAIEYDEDYQPCPFCTTNQTALDTDVVWDGESYVHFVVCENCGAEGPRDIDRDDAIDLWNGREDE